MQINIYRVTITVEKKETRLTKAIAKQFPVRHGGIRSGYASEVKEPICKIAGSILGSSASWLYLVQDAEAGLAWEPACIYRTGYHTEEMRERGYNVDSPSQVPTVIL